MPNSLVGVLARIPGYGGYLAKKQYDQEQQLGDLRGGVMGTAILQHLHDQARQQQYEQAIAGAGPDATPQALANIAVPYSKPGEVLGRETSLMSHQDTLAANKEATTGRLQLGLGQLQLQSQAEDRKANDATLTREDRALAARNSEDLKRQGLQIQQQLTDLKAQQQGGDQQSAETVAQGIAGGKLPPLSGWVMKSPWGQTVMSRVMEINPEYDVKSTFDVPLKAMKDFSTGKQGNTVRSFNVALYHLGTLDKLADALSNNDLKQVNRFSQMVAEQTGNPAPLNFDAAKKIVADEIVKAIVGSGGGVTDREEAAKTINRANTPAQLKGAISTYKELMQGQLKGLQQQYESSTGKTDFNKFLTPESLAQPSVSGNSVLEFSTEADAAKANLKPGTKVKIGGIMGTWQ